MSRYVQNDYDNEEGYAKKSMVLGICSIVAPYLVVKVLQILLAGADLPDLISIASLFCPIILRVVLAIFALTYYGKWKSEEGFESQYAKAGKVCGIIGLILGIIPLVLLVGAIILLPIFFPDGLVNLPS